MKRIFLFAVVLGLTAPPSIVRSQEVETKTGRAVEERVKKLKKHNKKVAGALQVFEENAKRSGRLPQFDKAWSVSKKSSGTQAKGARKSPMTKVGLRPQMISGDGLEVLFIPTMDTPFEWQGTVIFTHYDGGGGFLGEYVCDVDIINDYSIGVWRVVYEVSFDENGYGWMESLASEGMITDRYFQFGTPAEQQPTGGDGYIPPLIGARLAQPKFQVANFIMPQRGVGFPGLGFGARSIGSPKARQFSKCAVGQCAAWGGLGCGVSSILSFGASFGPCAAGACAATTAGCAFSALGWG